MKKPLFLVALAVPAIIEAALRYPVEGPFTVDLDEANRLHNAGVLTDEPEEVVEDADDDLDEADGLDKLKVTDLDKVIADEGVEVEPNANKTAKIAAIRAARSGE